MTKMQKIWLGVSLAMFLAPETLWSPVGNFVYTFYKGGNMPIIFRDNFLMSTDYRNSLLFVLFIQLVGVVSSLFLVLKSKSNFWLKLGSVFVLSAVTIITGFVFYVGFSLRHGIGF